MKKIKDFIKTNGLAWLVSAMITIYCLPTILCAFLMFLTNNFLTDSTVLALNVISFILTYFLFIIGLSKIVEKDIKKGIINSLPVAIGFLLIIVINLFLNTTGLGINLIVGIINNILGGLIVVASLVISIALINEKKMILNVSNCMKLVGLSLLTFALPSVIGVLLSLVLGGNYIVSTLFIFLICALVEAIFMVITIKYIKEKSTESISSGIKGIILIGITIGLLAVYFILSFLFNKQDNVKSIDNYMSYSLATGDYAFDNQDILLAKNFYESAKEFKCAWEYVLDEENDGRGCNGDYITLFKTLNDENAINILKKKVNNKTATNYDLEALMHLMQESKDKEIGKVTRFLISEMKFTRTAILPFDISESEQSKIKDKLTKYNNYLIARKYIDVYAEWLNQGEINSMVINKASGIADEYPDVLGLQKAAINFYLNASDKINGSTGVVNRFVELTKDSLKDLNDEQIINYKTYVAAAYHRTNGDDKLIEFLENTYPDKINDYLGEELIVSYKNSRNHEKASSVALNVLRKNPENVTALAYLAIYTLQSDLDSSINYALKLSDIIKNKKDNQREADIALGMYMLYLFGFYEVPDSVFCPYHNFYSDMSDEQKDLFKNNEIINAYIAGYRRTDGNREILDSVLAKYDITYLLYYRGSMEVNNKEFEAAVKDLEKAITLGNNHPFIYSELGFAYEGVGDLQKSLIAFEKADQIIDELGLGATTYNYNNIHNYFSVYINNAKHAMYESEGDHNE